MLGDAGLVAICPLGALSEGTQAGNLLTTSALMPWACPTPTLARGRASDDDVGIDIVQDQAT